MSQFLNQLGQVVGQPIQNWVAPPVPPRQAMMGKYCRLEPLIPATHTKSLYEANNLDRDGRMWTYLPYGPFENFAQYHAWIEKVSQEEDPLFFAILDNKRERAIGVASYLRIDVNNGCIEVGHLAYSPLLQRTVVATEAMYLMMAQAFALGYRRYEWKCNALNQPSRSAAERLGFQFEGIFRQSLVTKGRNRDTAWYSIIDGEWPELEKAYIRWLAENNFDEQGQQRTSLAHLIQSLREQG